MKIPVRILFWIALIFAWIADTTAQKCPRNQYDCPGLCGWFVDTNRDGYCDLSLFSEPVIAGFKKKQDSLRMAETRKLAADSAAEASKRGHGNENNAILAQNTIPASGQNPADNDIGAANQATQKSENDHSSVKPSEGGSPQKKLTSPIKKAYDFFLIFGISLGLYLLTFFLSRRGIIKKTTHRKIWNVLLLLAFLPTAVIGLLLALQANYAFWLGSFADLLYWHVEFAIAMAAIAIFHILWHLRYWSMLLKKTRKCNDGE